jgi:hypothetical protein
MTKIYKLNHGTVTKYIGKTKRTLEQRFLEHVKSKNLPAHEYSIELICEVDDDMAATIENLNINSYNTIIEGLNKIQGKGKMSSNVKQHKYDEAMKKAKKSIQSDH